MANGLHIILGDPQVKSVFVNVFGGITACDAVANGIVGALDKLGDEATKPLVVRLDGNNVDEGRRILAERNHPLVSIEGMRTPIMPCRRRPPAVGAAGGTGDPGRRSLSWKSPPRVEPDSRLTSSNPNHADTRSA